MTGSQFTTWRTSSYSGSNGGDCVEVARADTAIGVRDSKHRDAGHLAVETHAWSQLRAQIQHSRH